MKQYINVLQEIMEKGIDRQGRNGFTRALFTKQMRFDLNKGFPAVTTKKLAFKAVAGELLWFLEGSGDDNRLKEIMGKDKTIWTANSEADYWQDRSKFPGDLGRVYGVQWRDWRNRHDEKIDQLKDVLDRLKKDPHDRRLIVSAWNPGELNEMALPPCHMIWQLFAADNKLSLHMFQRSCDMFLGVPFNIASYALLLHLIARESNMIADELILTLGDAHIYHDHFLAVEEQIKRDPLPLPELWLNPNLKRIEDFKLEDIKLKNYQHHPPIKADMAV